MLLELIIKIPLTSQNYYFSPWILCDSTVHDLMYPEIFIFDHKKFTKHIVAVLFPSKNREYKNCGFATLILFQLCLALGEVDRFQVKVSLFLFTKFKKHM